MLSRAKQHVQTFHERYPWLGPLLWVLGVEYYVVQAVVAAAWPTPGYSWSANTISDLGNTVCGQFNDRFVCSPLHSLMDLSFIALGLVMMLGAALIYQEFRGKKLSLLGFDLLALAGAGAILVGFFPENYIGYLHVIGAWLALFWGHVGLVILSFSLPLPRWLRTYTFASGAIALVALILYGLGYHLGLGQGGMERLAAYPQTLWLIIFGLYMTRSHFRRQK